MVGGYTGFCFERPGVEGDSARIGIEEEAVIDVGVGGTKEEGNVGLEAGIGAGGGVGNGDAGGIDGEVSCCWESDDCAGNGRI